MPQTGRAQPLGPGKVIDLTDSDDDENDLMLYNGAHSIINHAPAPGVTARLSYEFLDSHDGLPYDFSAASLNQASIPPNGLPRLRAPVNPSRRSTKLYRGSARDPARDFESENNSRGLDKLGSLPEDIESIANPTKRRKTDHGGVLPAKPVVTGTPAIRPGDVPRASTTAGSGPVLTRNTIITGESRAQASGRPSRISTNGAVQKLRSTEAQAMDFALRRQVLPYLTSSAKRYSKSIREADRTAIVTKAARVLVDDQSFKDNFDTHNWKLSTEYERQISIKAVTLVDKLANQIMNASHVLRASSTTSRNSVAGLSSSSISYRSSRTQNAPRNHDSSSDEEEIFEPRAYSTTSGQACPSSLSPTTSYSIENADAADAMDIETALSTRSKVTVGRKTKDGSKAPAPSRTVTTRSSAGRRPKSTRGSKIITSQGASSKKPTPVAAPCVVYRPYLIYSERKAVQNALLGKYTTQFLSEAERKLLETDILHVPFSDDEMFMISSHLREEKRATDQDDMDLDLSVAEELVSLMAGSRKLIPNIIRTVEMIRKPGQMLNDRDSSAVSALLMDATAGNLDKIQAFVELRPIRRQKTNGSCLNSALRQREMLGLSPVRIARGQEPFRATITDLIEDTLVRKSEWTNSSGDVTTITWRSNWNSQLQIEEGVEEGFVCGAVAHSDNHNMQYNKPGNLLLGSVPRDTVRSFDHHRIVRPLVAPAENAANSLPSMRLTQDPWLYTSVVSAAHCRESGLTFTASFDRTVKVWSVAKDGSSMDIRGTWDHDGIVDFVVTSKCHNLVATASRSKINSVRVYNVDEHEISKSPFDSYGGNKSSEQAEDVHSESKWAYYPATIQWGRAEVCADLLLVGYSPRSDSGEDSDIPDEKKHTGELCLWNARNGEPLRITSRSQNVFDVAWHPSHPIFVVATSPSGAYNSDTTKTQIRLFCNSQLKPDVFSPIRTLDCPAIDINSLTIRPNSLEKSYITASCTDGCTYVWDTARGDAAIHILQHAGPVDPAEDIPLELADEGIQFAAWGQSSSRFYTGGSDGRLKAWDIKRPAGKAFVRNILTVAGGITAGAFSADGSRLLIGDATGKAHLLEFDDDGFGEEQEKATPVTLGSRGLLEIGGILPSNIRRPKLIVPHADPEPPAGSETVGSSNEESGPELGHNFLEEGQITQHRSKAIGAIQGPNYRELGLYRLEAHEEEDCEKPLLASWQAKQLETIHQKSGKELKLPILQKPLGSNVAQHKYNVSLDFNFEALTLETREELEKDRVDLKGWDSHKFFFEPSPKSSIFSRGWHLDGWDG